MDSKFSVFDYETRFQQTLDTIRSVHDHVPDVKILLIDNSTVPIPDDKVEILKKLVTHYVSISEHSTSRHLNSLGLRSHSEIYTMVVAMAAIKEMGMIGTRIFKLSGRYVLTDKFNIKDYDNPELKNKYVFLTRIQSWIRENLRCLNARLFSFDSSLYTEFVELLPKLMDTLVTSKFDIEHAYMMNIDPESLVEWDVIGLKGNIAPTGDPIDE